MVANIVAIASKNMFDFASMSPLLSFVILPEALEHFIDFTLSHPNVQGLMNENFDAVIVETFHSEALLGKPIEVQCQV